MSKRKKIHSVINFALVLTVIFSTVLITRMSGESEAFAASPVTQSLQNTQQPAVQAPVLPAKTPPVQVATNQVPTAQTTPLNVVPTAVPNAIPTTIPAKNAYELAHRGQMGFKYQVYKFFTAMFAVLVSALAIFFGLKIYKQVLLKKNSNLDNIDYDKTLETPKDFKEAVNLFLNKTDKE